MVTNDASYPLGIDISNNNGVIIWPRVAAAGVQFAICKASEGTGFVDRFMFGNVVGCRENGILAGYYHFARPSQNPARAEADFFVETVARQLNIDTGEVIALDLEDEAASGDLSDWTLTWLQRVEELVGFKPLCYTSPGYAQAHGLANRPEIGQYGLWLASWGVPTPPPPTPPWDLVAIHQFAVGAAGTIPGVAGEIDLNHYNGPISTLPLYGKPAAEPPADPPPLPPPPPLLTPAEVRAELSRIVSQPDEVIVGRYLRAEIVALLERMP